MVVNQLKVHPLSKFWFSTANLHPYTAEFHGAGGEDAGGLAGAIQELQRECTRAGRAG